jgi:hypothetical protein
VPINPLYAQLGAAAVDSGEKLPAFKFEAIGSGVAGVIDYVGEPFTRENKFYVPAIIDSTGVELKPAQGQKETTSVKVNITCADGAKWSIYLQKPGQFKAIADALVEAELSDLTVGWTLAIKRIPGKPGNNAHLFQARLIPPTN